MSEQRDPPPHDSDLSRHILPTSTTMVGSCTTMVGVHLAAGALLILAGCETLPRQFDAITHPPIPSSYDWRKDAAGWMKKTFDDPASLRSVMIGDPIVFDYPSSPATWLVCVELDVRDSTGAYMGPKRFALGFQTSRVSSAAKTSVNFIGPESQQGIANFVCNREDIFLKPWTDWEQSYRPK